LDDTATIEKRESMNEKEKGSAIVEFALAALFLMMVLFAIIEFSYLWWVNLSMQHAVREGARYASVTGSSNFPLIPGNPATSAQQRCDAVVTAIKANSMGVYDRVSPILTYSTVDPATGNIVAMASGCGGASQIIMIKLVCALPLITPIMKPFFTNGKYNFTVNATILNEAFK
jgi:Flp pilus assembly protein TadG